MPGHGWRLSGAQAWDAIHSHLVLARYKNPNLEWGEPRYHRIPEDKIPEDLQIVGDIVVMAVPITVHQVKSPLDGSILYLCVQVDSVDERQITPAAMEAGRQGTGRQFAIDFQVDKERCRGLVWLK